MHYGMIILLTVPTFHHIILTKVLILFWFTSDWDNFICSLSSFFFLFLHQHQITFMERGKIVDFYIQFVKDDRPQQIYSFIPIYVCICVIIFLIFQCIYGCYVHSAILPTFHRRCYWLLQVKYVTIFHEDGGGSIPYLGRPF